MCRDLPCERKYIYYTKCINFQQTTGCAAREVGWTLRDGQTRHSSGSSISNKDSQQQISLPHLYLQFVLLILLLLLFFFLLRTTCWRVPRYARACQFFTSFSLFCAQITHNWSLICLKLYIYIFIIMRIYSHAQV